MILILDRSWRHLAECFRVKFPQEAAKDPDLQYRLCNRTRCCHRDWNGEPSRQADAMPHSGTPCPMKKKSGERGMSAP